MDEQSFNNGGQITGLMHQSNILAVTVDLLGVYLLVVNLNSTQVQIGTVQNVTVPNSQQTNLLYKLPFFWSLNNIDHCHFLGMTLSTY